MVQTKFTTIINSALVISAIPKPTFGLKKTAVSVGIAAYNTLEAITRSCHEPAKTRIYIVKMRN
jgi:hypothetical protein